MAHTLPVLPYSYEALEPLLDRKTMEAHHKGIHQHYLEALNAAVKATAVENERAEALLSGWKEMPLDVPEDVRDAAGGFVNHSLFWTFLTAPKKQRPIPKDLHAALTNDFGSVARFKETFRLSALSLFGSGWTWMTFDGMRLRIENSINENSPLLESRVPVLGLDMWEHAYYLRYRDRKEDYIESFFSLIDWQQVENYLCMVQARECGQSWSYL